MTPFDNYLDHVTQHPPQVVILATIFIWGLISGIICTTLYCILICTETRSQRIKRVYNHKFNHKIKRELL